ncbi:MAG: shikimate kinase / 3-dehydroquinate synthase [Solirubrobacteraceae bacterium]|nr:shikimate kinase / 3-dehydroquinate synthase [Solirubrobacteraceae bacterium]
MGAGKTSAARAAAAALGGRPADSDQLIEAELGMTIEAWFEHHGERAFREREEALVLAMLDDPPAPVISLGGGAVTSERVQAALARHTVVLLDVDADTAWQRAGGRRPLARDRRRFDELLAARQPLYERLADAILPTSRRETLRHALPAIGRLADAPAGTKLLWAESASGNYPVYVGDGVRTFAPIAGRGFTISDEHVAALYGPADHVMGAGEAHKTLGTAEAALRAMAQAGLAHGDHVRAVGGGVVGDVAGFCAAVYQRGIGVVQVPTTVVAQVDSAYGGKTGVDLPEGKNYAGAYHQPSAVLADTSTLATLPEAESAAGWAEVVKTALIAGGALWRRVHEAPVVDRDVVLACARTKLAVVAEDERDAGRRQTLNLGHTVGHAIETATDYRRYRHGEAVGLGLLAAMSLSNQPGLRADVERLLAGRGLPTRLDPAVDLAAVRAAIERDKKRRDGRVGFVLVEAPGELDTGIAVPEADLQAALAELAR